VRDWSPVPLFVENPLNKDAKSGRRAGSSEEAYDHAITRTDDFKTWSGNGSSFVS